MKKLLVAGVVLACLASPARADLTPSINALFGTEAQGCDSTVKLKLGEAIRKGINDEVLRRETAIKNPVALSALSCIDNLIATNLDFHVAVPNLKGIFNQALTDQTNKLCAMANEKLAELTAPLRELLSFDLLSKLEIPGVSGGGSVNIVLGEGTIGGGPVGASPNIGRARETTEGSLTEESLRELFGEPN